MDTTNIHYDEDYIIKQYNQGRTQKHIADELGTYNTTIRRILIRNGITPRGQEIVRSTISENPFVGDEISNYFIGYIIADGNLGKNHYSINLSTNKDFYMLDKFKKFSKSTNKVRKYKDKKCNSINGSFEFSHKPTWEYLNSLGITPKKSLTFKFKGKLNRDIIRGVFDGDGTVRITNKRKNNSGYSAPSIFTASKEFAVQLFEELIEFKPTLTKGADGYSIGIYTQKNIREFYNYLYLDATIFLKRKEEKYRLNMR